MTKAVSASVFGIVVLLCVQAQSVQARPAVAADDLFVDVEDGPVAGNVLANDSPGLVVTGFTPPALGVLNVTPAGDALFTPPPDWSGEVTFKYTVLDGDPVCANPMPPADCSATGTGVIHVLADVDLPALTASDVSGDEDTDIPLALSVVENDTDGSQFLSAVISNVPAGATLNAGVDLGGGNWDVPLAALGGLTFTPPPDLNGSGVLVLGVSVVDIALDGAFNVINADFDFTSAPFLMTVDPVNDPPVQVGPLPLVTTDEDVDVSVDLSGVWDDVDIATNGDVLSYSVTSIDNPAIASATMTGAQLDIVLLPDQNGPGSVRVRVEDSEGKQLDADISVVVASVNDDPQTVGSVSDVAVDEDSNPVEVDFKGVFTDVDIATNDDSLTLSASIVSGGTPIGVMTFSGEKLTIPFVADQNGPSVVRVTATDSAGATATYDLNVSVNSVNDAPTVAGLPGPVTMAEDDPPLSVPLAGFFDDVDIATNGDSLSFEITGNTNPGLFSATSVVGDQLMLAPAADMNGAATISVRAVDQAGVPSPSADMFVTITSVNDIPDAANDIVPWTEDGGVLTIPVLDNDYLAETPTTITAVTQGGQFTIVDENGDAITSANATITINGDDVVFDPAPNFNGTDTFTYTITDADGDTDTATVTVVVAAVNDEPYGVQLREFSMLKNDALVVDAANGVFLGAYDVDGKRLDDDGNEIGSPLAAQVTEFPAPTEGALTFDQLTGEFLFVPVIDYVGTVEFRYRLFDNDAFSSLPEYVVRISVREGAPPPPPPPAGQVAVTYNLSQTPLEQSGTVPPNVLVLMDDSGSMDWNMIVDGLDDQGGFFLDNDKVAKSVIREESYRYLWDLASNAYPASSDSGRVLPTEEALAADANMAGNEYGVWRARTHLHNAIYYNPEVTYEPWVGLDADNVDFADAVPTAIRLDPVDPEDVFDMLSPHSYRATGVPQWDANGGTENISVDDIYIPFYYATAAAPPLAWNDPHNKVEIRPENAPFAGGPNREDCRDDGDPMLCTYAQEIQNFANWFQYHRSREYVTKGAMGGVIAELQDVRVGYETISNTTSEPIRHLNDKYFEGDKKKLLDTVYRVDSYGGTPLRQLLDRGGKVLGCKTGDYCPALAAPEGICQQNFALLFSDGYWNGGAGVSVNADEDGVGPEGPFDGGKYADTYSATLADTAMYHYETDMFDAVDNGVPVTIRDIEGAPDGHFQDGDTMHQHMKTYTIAFGVEGTIDPAAPYAADVGSPFAWSDPFDKPAMKIDDLLHAAVNGRGSYLSAGNPQELQAAIESSFLEFTQAASSTSAAAFNSTSLREGTLLYRGFYDLRTRTGELTATSIDDSGVVAADPTWLASEQLDPANKQPDARVLVTYDPIADAGKAFRYTNLTPAQKLTMSEAQVDFIRGERDDELPLGTLRERELSGGLLGPIVNSSPVFVGEPRAINRDQAPYPTDDLYSDFVAAVADRTPVVYVGGNDGIMHGFHAATGEELYGFIPNKILDSSARYANRLSEFTSPFYFHNYYVDLSPRLNDVYTRRSAGGSKEWATVLIGGLGAGGKGFFALDVTDPDTTFASEANAAASVLWEFTDDDDTYPVDDTGSPIGAGALVDPDGQPIKDLGYAVSLPVVQMTNTQDGSGDNEWAAIFGNGMNSTSGIAKLFVLLIDRGIGGWDDGDVIKIDTGYGVALPGEQLEGYPNVLGSPTAVDRDLNGTVDYVYAGDRRGNLFRFDLTSDDPDDWNAVRLFTATYNDGVDDVVQPIVSRPTVVKHPKEVGFLVTFGTGSLLTRDDVGNNQVQSIYTIWDRLAANPATAAADTKSERLVEQTITNVVDDSVNPAQTRRIVSNNAVEYVPDGVDPGVYGWYIDLDMQRAANTLSGAVNPDFSGNAPPDPQFPGEKAIRRILYRDGSLITTTVLPAMDDTTCIGARAGAILIMNALTGGDAAAPIIDFNTDGTVDEHDLVTVGGAAFSGGLLFNQGDLDGSLVDLTTLGGEGDTDFLFVSGGDETISFRIENVNDSKTGRLSWIERDDVTQ